MLAVDADGGCSFFFLLPIIFLFFSLSLGTGFYVLFNRISVVSRRWVDDCAQWNPVYDQKDPGLKRCSNPGPLDQQASDYTTELPGLLSLEGGSI